MVETKILLVEDEVETHQIMTRCLGRKGYFVISALNAKQGLELVGKEHPDIVLLDIRLSDGSGLEVLRQIKEMDKNIKVIMVSALEDEATIHQAKSLGADDYVTKPLTVDFLNNIILEKISELSLHREIMEIDKDTG